MAQCLEIVSINFEIKPIKMQKNLYLLQHGVKSTVPKMNDEFAMKCRVLQGSSSLKITYLNLQA